MEKIIHSYPLSRCKRELKKRAVLGVLFLVCCAFSNGYAQDLTVSGKITDESTGKPLFGVNVIVKGTVNGVSSDLNGDYTIKNVTPENILMFSYMGFTDQEIRIGNTTEINVVLTPSVDQLDELVIVGYGTKKKRNLTGAIVSVGSEDIDKSNLQDPISILQGRAAGVQVTSNSGAPGGGMSIKVRGNSSLNSGNSPLYVVDGVAIESTSLSSLNGSENFGLNPLADINPGDIQSIEILKDAASTAIYGSRAANGVVLITTKRGISGKAQVDLNLSSGVSEIPRRLSVLNASQYRQVILDSYRNMDNPVTPNGIILDSLNPKNNGDVDWQKELLRIAPQYKIDLSVRGGTEDLKYAWSSSFLNQDGVILNSNYKRVTTRLNVDFKVSDKITFGQSISYTNGVNNRINAAGTGNLSVIRELLVRPPIFAAYLPDGSYNGYQFGRRNPIGLAELATHLNKSNRVIGNQYVEYKILESLKLRSNLNLDYISIKEDEFIPSTLDYREGYNSGSVRALNNLTWGNETFLTFNKQLGGSHNLSALAGFSFQDWKYERVGLDGMFFSSDNITTLNGAGTISNQEVNITTEHSLLSYFGRVSYDYKGKYLFEANLRADGSSRFGKDKRFGYFPSAAIAWRFSDESFFENLNVVNDAKLRLSAGQTGNEAIGNYTSQGEFAVGANYLDFSGAAPSVMPNSGLTWETTTQYNAGLDISLWKNRVTLTADAYLKVTEDLLYNVPIPRTTGFSFVTQNIGSIENKGIELAITSQNLVGDLKWETNFNISSNSNMIKDLPENLLTNGFIQNGNFHILKEGLPIGTFYGYKFNGVYSRDEDNVNQVTNGALGQQFKGGDPIWDDVNGDNIIDENDRQIIGDATPDFFGGLNNTFSYKGLSLGVFLQFSYGNDIYSEINHQRNSVVRYNNLSTDALDRWREQGDVTNFPKPVSDDPLRSDSRVQSRWVEDGSYIKLKNINIRYRFPDAMVDNLGMRKLEVYASALNVLTWTHYTGFDPDVNSYSGLREGIDEGSYPQSRTVMLGLNIGF
ncbi:TonB-linked SusC/RagA family outer membrane protein [Gelidibacter algens]|uniref:TonB-linked SusC/RagA family outer membrane protein n=1 Tax=Gelidibacter algens TaxID=49280 RepID=A0A1A7R5L5_9FLAO|nr:TonB-dependent receptor [Gelidibacter algens]OBX26047.1 SusC/RagA family TonB-linked outer membrane protein [Gelidibacter algens]RAJ27681.1 TonB-linked SusC/RagA family outer membrane protein [Gelidibacter algens]